MAELLRTRLKTGYNYVTIYTSSIVGKYRHMLGAARDPEQGRHN